MSIEGINVKDKSSQISYVPFIPRLRKWKKDQKRKKNQNLMVFANIFLQTILTKILNKATKTSYNYILIKQF